MENIIKAILKMLESKSIDAEGALSLIHEVRAAYSYTTCNTSPGKSEYTNTSEKDNKVAIIGMALRFPGAENPEEFWELLKEGKDCITQFPEDRYPLREFYSEGEQQTGKSYSKWGGFIENVKQFSTGYFKIEQEEAKYIDPEQRIFLEIANEAFQAAGYSKKRLSGTKTAVIAGARKSGYDTSEDRIGTPKNITGSITNFIAARVSDFFNLKGSSFTIDTACSSSLTAIHYGCEMLKNKECDMVLAGGIDLKITPVPYITLSDAKALSQNGRCYTFDRRANGFVPGEGGGAVLLKPYNKALEDGDFIYASISGSEVNNDGHTMGITTPNFEGQKELLRQAYQKAKVNPMEVSYMEAHGTGTLIGDPIEIKALTEFYKEYTDRKGFCAIGSVKTNIGHLDTAAGIAGFIKAVLSLYHKKIVPTLHCNIPNNRLNFLTSPFFPATSLTDFKPIGKIRRAAVSSFGFGGTNCHVILEENNSVEEENKVAKIGDCILTLSAENISNLRNLSHLYRKALENNPSIPLHNFCHTANTAREVLSYRAAFCMKDKQEAIHKLINIENCSKTADVLQGICIEEVKENVNPSVAMVFPGQGSQYSNMAKNLYETLPEFKKAFDECVGYASQIINISLKEIVFQKDKEELLNQTCFTQPALFSVCYALAQVWLSCGVKPKVVLGHSVGEFVAACIAGILTLKDAVTLVCIRGSLIQKLPLTGSMIIVFAQLNQVSEIMKELRVEERRQISIAAINSPANIVVSGDTKVINRLVLLLQDKSVRCAKLNVSHAFHSMLMEPILKEYMEMLNTLSFHNVKIPLIQNVSGELLRKGSLNKEYWGRHLMQTVLFEESIKTALLSGINIFLEVGPGTTASKMIKDIIKDENKAVMIHTLDRKKDDVTAMYEAAVQLFTQGINLHFQNLEYRSVRTVIIPTCPLVKETCWIEQYRPYRLQKSETQKEIIEVISQKNLILKDHVVNQNNIFPGAALWEMVIRNASSLYKRRVTGLKNMKHISQLALITESELKIKVRYEEEKNSFKVFYSTDLTKDWKLCASGAIDFMETKANEKLDLKSLISEFNESALTQGELYRQFRQKGVDYGEAFQSIERIWTKDNQVIAKLKLPELNERNYLYHPGFVDGGLQSIIGLTQEGTQNDTYIPFLVNEVILYKSLPSEGYSLLTMTGNSKEVITVDIVITDTEGNIVLKIIRHAFKKVREIAGTNTSLKEQRHKGYLYIPKYVEKQYADRESKNSYSVVIFGDRDTISQNIFMSFQEKNVPVICCCKGNNFLEIDKQTIMMDFCSASHYTLLYEKLRAEGFQNIKFIRLLPKTYITDISQERDLYFASAEEELESFTKILQGMDKEPDCYVTEILIVSVEEFGSTSMFHTTKSVVEGFMKSAQREYSNTKFKLIQADNSEGLFEYIRNEIESKDTDGMIQYLQGRRRVQSLEPIKDNHYSINDIRIKKEDTYIITGGLSGIGFRLAEFISQKYGANLILISRTGLPDESTWSSYLLKAAKQDETASKIRAIQKMNENGSCIKLVKLDVTSESQVENFFSQLSSKERIDGIFHLAGILRDSLIKNKFIVNISKVCAPKVKGSIHIAEALKRVNPSFVVLFSSIASFFGSMGQADYASANSFMDDYAEYITNNLGIKAIAINWTMWDGVGMGVRSGQVDIKKSIGITPFKAEDGFRTLEQILKLNVNQVIALNNPIEDLVINTVGENHNKEKKETYKEGSADAEELEIAIEKELKEKIAEILEVGTEEINTYVNFMELGLDSVSIVDFTTWVGERIKAELYPTLLFEYSSIKEFTAYLLENHMECFTTLSDRKETVNPDTSMEKNDSEKEVQNEKNVNRMEADEKATTQISTVKKATPAIETGDIAIIGYSGMFPGAKDTDEYWENLKKGVNAITTAPLNRFKDASNSEFHGGFLTDVDCFDPLFFNISPTEAVFIDPQQRLFLENVWKTLDMAGYSQKRLKNKKVGVYVGASQVEYKKLCEDSGITSPYMGLGNALCVIANRVSYLLNLKGPSMAVDSACSSSLVALELACRALQNQEADMAVAGGVQLYFTGDSFRVFKAAGMLSKEGKCKTFDAGADGYVRGEGVGAVLLKPYHKAVLDGDTIYAVIKGIAVNHDGNDKVGISAPNPNGQKEVILEAIKKAGIHPEDISYFEAHGTGTSLGDPVEIRGLSQAYAAYTDRKSFCAISTAKTSIGHLEACAGMAGLIKAILMLKNKELPPSIHFNKQNPHIPFISSPFYVNDKLKHWESPTKSRYAAISSFGFGGTNCHVVLSEYIQDSRGNKKSDDIGTQVMALSAKSYAALEEMITDFHRFIEENPSYSLKDICYSVNTGRDMFEYRACFVVDSIPDLKDKLQYTASLGIQSAADSESIMYSDNSSKSSKFAVMLRGDVLNGKESLIAIKAFDVFQIINEFEENVKLITGENLTKLLEKEQYDSARWLSFLTGYIKIMTLKKLGLDPSVYIISESQILLAGVLTKTIALKEAIAILSGKNQEITNIEDKKVLVFKESGLQEAYTKYLKDRQIENAFLFGEDTDKNIMFAKTDTKVWEVTNSTLSHITALAFSLGLEIDWLLYYQNETYNRIVLPAYPFQKKSYFVPYRVQKETRTKTDMKVPQGDIETENFKSESKFMTKSRDKVKSNTDMIRLLKGILSKLLTMKEEELDINLDFRNYGLDSLLIADAVKAIEEYLKVSLPHSIFMEHSTIEQLSRYLSENYGREAAVTKQKTAKINKKQGDVSTIKERRMNILKEVAGGGIDQKLALNALLHLEGGGEQC